MIVVIGAPPQTPAGEMISPAPLISAAAVAYSCTTLVGMKLMLFLGDRLWSKPPDWGSPETRRAEYALQKAYSANVGVRGRSPPPTGCGAEPHLTYSIINLPEGAMSLRSGLYMPSTAVGGMVNEPLLTARMEYEYFTVPAT